MNRLGALAVIRGGSGFPEIYQGLQSGDYPFVKVSDMALDGNHHYLDNANNYVDRALVERLRLTVFPEETIVFAKVGAAIYLNKRRQLRRPTIIDNNMMGVIPD
jgi:type I restriction enzyme, S subunit